MAFFLPPPRRICRHLRSSRVTAYSSTFRFFWCPEIAKNRDFFGLSGCPKIAVRTAFRTSPDMSGMSRKLLRRAIFWHPARTPFRWPKITIFRDFRDFCDFSRFLRFLRFLRFFADFWTFGHVRKVPEKYDSGHQKLDFLVSKNRTFWTFRT